MNDSVIILSDDEGGCTACPDDSVFIVEEAVPEITKSSEILDEDVTITYTQKAHVLPHARYDCTIPFCATEEGVSLEPVDSNAEFCEQCFCYVCDEQASKCKFWTVPGFCHCNAHKRSVYWKSLRDKKVMGYLSELSFPFSPQDMDSDLRRAESALQQFACSLAYQYTKYLAAFQSNQPICTHSADGRGRDCRTCNTKTQTPGQNSYIDVMESVFKFLDEAMEHTPKTCVVMLLGAVKLFISHKAPGNFHLAVMVSDVAQSLLWRVTSRVQTLLVNSDFPSSFTKQLQQFFLALPFPPECRWLRNSLNVLPWDNLLLSAVLRGQNLTGERNIRGRKTEVLLETIVVIQARVCILQQQNKYCELARYLKVVKCDNIAALQVIKDWVPLYLCKDGRFAGAVSALFFSKSGCLCAASRLSEPQFAAYIRILTSGHAPTPHPPQVSFTPHSGVVLTSQQDPLLSSDWTPIGGEFSKLSRLEVLKFVLRVLNCNNEVFTHPESWVNLLNLASACTTGPDGVKDGVALAEPDVNFLIRTRQIAENILTELTHSSRIQIPKIFQTDYPEQALLLLATQALSSRILHSRLCPILKVIMTFKLNPWALRWLFYSLTVRPGVLDDLLCVIVDELLKEPHHPCLPREDSLGQSFIASFLCLFFLEHSVLLDAHEYPATVLLSNWNESRYPWQKCLRRQLEFNVSLLTPDKLRILHMIR